MNYLFAALVIAQLCLQSSLVNAFCGKRGTFDYACRTEGHLFIVSTFPCQSAGLVRITVVPESSPENVIVKDFYKDTIFRLGKLLKWVNVLLANHTKGPKEGNLHVFVNILDENRHSKRLFSTYFFLMWHSNRCEEMFTGASHYASPYCAFSKPTGDFSTLCIAKKGVLDAATQLVAFVALDPCTFPFSAETLLFIPNKPKELVNIYTANKTDSFVRLEDKSGKGMKLKINYYKDGLILNLVLQFGSTDKNSVELINGRYFPDDGLLCPTSNCTVLMPGKQACESSLITGEKLTKKLFTTISIGQCSNFDLATISMRLEGYTKTINGTIKLQPLEHEEEDNVIRHVRFTDKKVFPYNGNGFLPEDGGEISLALMESYEIGRFTTRRNADTAAFIVLRHYPLPEYAFPLLRTEFLVDGIECHNGQPEKRTVAKAVIGVVTILLVTVVIVLIALWWRKRNMKKEVGLPYQMELEAEDPQDLQM